MTETVKIISPVDGSVYAERPVASGAEIDAAVAARPCARRRSGAQVTIAERARYLLAISSTRCSP